VQQLRRRGAKILKPTHLYLSRYGMVVRGLEWPGFEMDLPFCSLCATLKNRRPVTVAGVRCRFLSGKVTRISLYCRNHAFALSFKGLNLPLVTAGWLQVIDGAPKAECHVGQLA
jgi:hypothetical protein